MASCGFFESAAGCRVYGKGNALYRGRASCRDVSGIGRSPIRGHSRGFRVEPAISGGHFRHGRNGSAIGIIVSVLGNLVERHSGVWASVPGATIGRPAPRPQTGCKATPLQGRDTAAIPRECRRFCRPMRGPSNGPTRSALPWYGGGLFGATQSPRERLIGRIGGVDGADRASAADVSGNRCVDGTKWRA
jgi:hypothetical protein